MVQQLVYKHKNVSVTVPHTLWGEKNELSVALTSSHLQHHVHRYPSVHHVLIRKNRHKEHYLLINRSKWPKYSSNLFCTPPFKVLIYLCEMPDYTSLQWKQWNNFLTSTQSGSSYHVNIELIQAAERRLCDGPKGENKANSGEGALAPGQRAHVTQVGLFPLTRLHLCRRAPQFQLVLVAAKTSLLKISPTQPRDTFMTALVSMGG